MLWCWLFLLSNTPSNDVQQLFFHHQRISRCLWRFVQRRITRTITCSVEVIDNLAPIVDAMVDDIVRCVRICVLLRCCVDTCGMPSIHVHWKALLYRWMSSHLIFLRCLFLVCSSWEAALPPGNPRKQPSLPFDIGDFLRTAVDDKVSTTAGWFFSMAGVMFCTIVFLSAFGEETQSDYSGICRSDR